MIINIIIDIWDDVLWYNSNSWLRRSSGRGRSGDPQLGLMSTAHLRRLLDQAGQIEHLQELLSNDAIDGELNEETERIVRIEEEAQIVLE